MLLMLIYELFVCLIYKNYIYLHVPSNEEIIKFMIVYNINMVMLIPISSILLQISKDQTDRNFLFCVMAFSTTFVILLCMYIMYIYQYKHNYSKSCCNDRKYLAHAFLIAMKTGAYICLTINVD